MQTDKEFLRVASPNEQRTISREDAGFYHAVIVGAVYKREAAVNPLTLYTLYGPLHCCIVENPYLSVIVGDAHANKSHFRHVTNINLDDHITILDQSKDGDDLTRIEEVLRSNLDIPFPHGIPPWKILVLPLQLGCFVAFAFSHAIGDGPTGTAFHRTFLRAWSRSPENAQLSSRSVEIPKRPLPVPFDTPQRLPISWWFLLSPLIALFLPSFIIKALGLRTSASATDMGTWKGSKIFYDHIHSHSKVKLRKVEASSLERTLCIARRHNAKLTAVFQLLVARALSKGVLDPKITNFVSQTAINMRGSIGVPSDQGGNFASGCYVVHPRYASVGAFTEEDWEIVRLSTRKLAESASTLQDQAIGLLRYVPSIRKWMFSKLGQQRDCSFELSNIGAFNVYGGSLSCVNKSTSISQMVFAQPGSVISAPLAFNIVSVKGGPLIYTVTWQNGALEVAEDEEESFVEEICSSIERDLAEMR